MSSAVESPQPSTDQSRRGNSRRWVGGVIVGVLAAVTVVAVANCAATATFFTYSDAPWRWIGNLLGLPASWSDYGVLSADPYFGFVALPLLGAGIAGLIWLRPRRWPTTTLAIITVVTAGATAAFQVFAIIIATE